MNLPNKITLTRIFMIPVFVAVFYCGLLSPWCYLASAIVFLLAALTDALDGHIARSRHLITDLGKFLDPIADKVLVEAAFIVMLTVPDTAFAVQPFGLYGLITAGVLIALVLARELIVSGFRIIAAGKKVVLAADKLGKIKTISHDIAITLLLVAMSLLQYGLAGEIVAYAGLVVFVFCSLMTIISGINYLVKNKAVLKDDETKNTEGNS